MSFVATAIGGALGAGGSIFGAITQANAEKQAAGTISQSTQQAIQQLFGFGQQGAQAIQGYTGQGAQALTNFLQPYANMGTQAGAELTSLFNPSTAWQTLQSLPGYQFNLNTGEQAINNAATTRGFGGNVLKAATDYAGGVAQNTWGQLTSGLQNLFSTGASAASTGGIGLANLFGGAGSSLANLFSGLGTGVSNLTSQAGQNIAQTQVGAANALSAGIGGGIGGVGNTLMMAALLGKGGLFGGIGKTA